MIKANELRLGNCVHNPFLIGKENSYKVKAHDFDSNRFEYFDPIPITPELLLKCDFEASSKYTLQYITGHYMLECDGQDLYLVIEGQVLKIPHLIYVHQLQNLVYSLSNRELNVSL